MVKRCVAAFCSNSNETGYAMHKFPKDPNLRRQWINFVRLKRADFAKATEHSVLCHIHFAPDCYERSYMEEMGIKKKKILLAGAVPTIQSSAVAESSNVPDSRKRPLESTEPELCDSDTDKRPRKSRAVQKLEINRVSRICSKYCIIVKLNYYYS